VGARLAHGAGDPDRGEEPLTKPPRHELEAHRASGEQVEALEEVEASPVAEGEPSGAAEPGQGALDDPPVPAKLVTALDPAPGDLGRDATFAQGFAAMREVVALVGGQLVWPLSWLADALPDQRHRLDQQLNQAP
jgi:hypothetical protein